MQTIFDHKSKNGAALVIAVVILIIAGFGAYSFVTDSTKEEDIIEAADTVETEVSEVNVVQSVKVAPDFNAKDVKLGKDISLARFKKMDVLLYFWDPYDAKQSARIERLIELQKSFKGKIAVIGIARNTGKLKMESLIKENKINFPVILSTDEIEKAYSASTDNSYCVLIGLDRTVLDSYTGVLNINKLSSMIEKDVK